MFYIIVTEIKQYIGALPYSPVIAASVNWFWWAFDINCGKIFVWRVVSVKAAKKKHVKICDQWVTLCQGVVLPIQYAQLLSRGGWVAVLYFVRDYYNYAWFVLSLHRVSTARNICRWGMVSCGHHEIENGVVVSEDYAVSGCTSIYNADSRLSPIFRPAIISHHAVPQRAVCTPKFLSRTTEWDGNSWEVYMVARVMHIH